MQLESSIFGVIPLFELSIFVKNIIYFNVAHYSKSIDKDINTQLGLLADHGKNADASQRHISESYIFKLYSFLTKPFKQNDGP